MALPLALALLPAIAGAQERLIVASAADAGVVATRADDASPSAGHALARFLLGGALGLGLHEAGHLALDASFGVKPQIKAVHFGPIPFIAISHRAGLPPRREFAISSAGFWTQHLSTEILFARRPRLRDERAPLLKGVLAFNVLASVAYAGAAFGKAGPIERDTRAMAESARVSERWVAALILAPAALDAWRYVRPGSRWAAWLSRGVKVGGVALVLR